MPSIQSKIFFTLLKVFNIKTFIRIFVQNGKQPEKPFFSNNEIKKHKISSVDIDQKAVWTLGGDKETSTHIIYFHGGMYAVEGTVNHKKWLLNLYQHSDCRITYINYPIAPEYTVDETLQMVVDSYQLLAEKFPDDHFILMGDSAGGGLALVLAQYLRDHGFSEQPEKLILYSPWVILDMQNPEIREIAQRDVLLDIDLLKKSAKQYAGDYDLSHKYLSPYYNTCQDLGKIHIFYGGDELLAPDINLLEQKCIGEHAHAYFYCYEGMQHVFQLFTFLPESRDVLRRTGRILTKDDRTDYNERQSDGGGKNDS